MEHTMTTVQTHSKRWTAYATCLLALAAASVHAQQTAAAKPTTAQAAPTAAAKPAAKPAGEEEEQAAKPKGPGSEGIKVHGHWKLDVHNPDGTFVKTYEFDNSLVTPNAADNVLTQLLSLQGALAGWAVYLNTTQNATVSPILCGDASSGYYSTAGWATCVLAPAQNPSTGTIMSLYNCLFFLCDYNLTTTAVPYNSTTKVGSYLQLQGNMTIPNAGVITSVATSLFECQTTGIATLSNQACNVPNYSAPGYTDAPTGTTINDPYFTSTTLPIPLTIAAGQIVTVTVQISFS